MQRTVKTLALDLYRLLFARPCFKTMNTSLLRVSLCGLGVMNYENSWATGEHYFLKYVLPKVVKSDSPVFFDIGANVGRFTTGLLQCFPQALVHSFEPHPETYRALSKQMEHNANVTCHNLALGAEGGKATLFDKSTHAGSTHASLYDRVILDIHKTGILRTDITIETMDNLAERLHTPFLDLVKIDTEGHELAVLCGASTLLANKQIGCIHFEFNEMNIISRSFFRDFRNLLHGYSLHRLLPKGLLPLSESPLETELFAFQNIVALRQ